MKRRDFDNLRKSWEPDRTPDSRRSSTDQASLRPHTLTDESPYSDLDSPVSGSRLSLSPVGVEEQADDDGPPRSPLQDESARVLGAPTPPRLTGSWRPSRQPLTLHTSRVRETTPFKPWHSGPIPAQHDHAGPGEETKMTQREDVLKFEQGRIKALQEERLAIQKKTFTKWMNSFLQKNSSPESLPPVRWKKTVQENMTREEVLITCTVQF
uniref:Uncharacterized protein n=1 Tax=Timema cristinae TaxID=61476 RepID=A0A7R9DEI2_TIMCR|nr:unnamed protein product [Timema cristinae]